MKIQITHDVYNIAKRVKKIHRDYFIVYNTSKNIFELHNSSQIGSSYCLTLPNELNERTLKYIRSTQSTNIEEILEKIENDNNILESANKISAFSNIAENLEQYFGDNNENC